MVTCQFSDGNIVQYFFCTQDIPYLLKTEYAPICRNENYNYILLIIINVCCQLLSIYVLIHFRIPF